MRVTLLNAKERSMRIGVLVNALRRCRQEKREVNKEELLLYIMEKFDCARRTALEYYIVADLRFNKENA